MGLRSSLVGVLAVIVSGCPTPMLHPLTASNGAYANLAFTVSALGGKQGTLYIDCNPTSGVNVVPSFAGALGYGHVFADRIGVQGGAYLLAMGNAQTAGLAGVAGVFSYLTVQNRFLSAGVGPEVTGTGASLTMGVEYRDDDLSHAMVPAVGAFARWFVPFTTRAPLGSYSGRIDHVFELGMRARFGILVAQYEYYADLDGPMQLPFIVEGSWYAEGLHMFSVGVTFDGEFAEHRRARRAARGRQ